MSVFDKHLNDREACATAAGRGAEYLDTHMPGWHRKINLDELEIESSCHCIIGQLVGSFYRAVEVGLEVTDSPAEVVRHGFDAGRVPFGFTTYSGLDRAWADEVRVRVRLDDDAEVPA